VANIGDIFFKLFLEDSNLTASASAEGAKAGDAAGKAMSTGIKGQLSGLFKGGIFAGAGIEIGMQALHGLEDAVGAVTSAIPNMLRAGQDFALNVEDISKKTGATTETASRFAGTLTYLGQSTDGLGMTLKTLSVQIASNEGQFTKLGIATRSSVNGPFLDTITILDNVRSYLSTAGDGATKLTLATHLLGKSAGNLIEYLDLTDAQAAQLNATMDALGVTMSEKAVSDVEGASREANLLGLAWQGFSNVLITEVVPTIRQVLGAAFQFIVDHGAEVRQTLIDITNAVLGFVEGLVGIEGVTPFQTQLDGLAGSSANVTLSMAQWAQQQGLTIPVIDTAAAATKAASAANTAATKAIETQTTALTALDKAQDKTYQTRLKSIKSLLDERMATLDAAEAARSLAQQQHDLNEQLNQAQIDLAAAQAGKGGKVDATAVSAAMAKVADVQKQQADLAHQTVVAQQKADIQSVKDYVDAIDQLVSDSTNKTATLADLKKREGALTAGGKPAAGSDAALELQAVLAAETRIRQQATNTANQQALDAKKAELAAEASAASSADSAKVIADKATLAKLKTQYQVYLDGQAIMTNKAVVAFMSLFAGDPKKGTGVGGAITKAFTDGQTSGEKFRLWIDTVLVPSVQGLLDIVAKVADAIGKIAGFLGQFPVPVQEALLGFITKGPAGALFAPAILAPPANPKTTIPGPGGIGGQPQDRLITDPGMPLGWLNPNNPEYIFRTRAAGGPVSAGMPYIVGERRQELFVPGESGRIVPSLGNLAGGSQTIEVPVYLDGEVITRVVSRHLADEYHR